MPKGQPLNLVGHPELLPDDCRWTVVADSGQRGKKYKSNGGSVLWLCRCVCGTEKLIATGNLRSGSSKGCSKCANEYSAKDGGRSYKHGKTGTPIYSRWAVIVYEKRKCGEKVDRRWVGSFENFYEDVGDIPDGKPYLNRIDRNGAWCKENCEWSEKPKRICKRNETVHGVTKSQAEWGECLGVSRERVRQLSDYFGSLESAIDRRADFNGVHWTTVVEDFTAYAVHGESGRKPKLHEHDGQEKTIREWAKEFDVSVQTIRRWINGKGSIAAGLLSCTYEYKGERRRINEWEQKLGIKRETLRNWIRRFGSIAGGFENRE